MPLSAGEKIRVLLKRKGITVGELADRLGTSRPNLSNKLQRDDFSEKEIQAIAKAMDCSVSITFKFKMTDGMEEEI